MHKSIKNNNMAQFHKDSAKIHNLFNNLKFNDHFVIIPNRTETDYNGWGWNDSPSVPDCFNGNEALRLVAMYVDNIYSLRHRFMQDPQETLDNYSVLGILQNHEITDEENYEWFKLEASFDEETSSWEFVFNLIFSIMYDTEVYIPINL
jgi:hypothetical protein